MQPSVLSSTQDELRKDEARNVVSTILEQIPDLVKVKSVRKRDGSMVDFAPEKLAATLDAALKEGGVNDTLILARCVSQACMRIEREFDGHTVPTTDDIIRVLAVVLIDNNLPFAVKKLFAGQSVEKKAVTRREPGTGLRFKRRYTTSGTHPYDRIEWELRDAVITNEKGKTVFEQRGVEVPKTWTQSATNIVVSKYFRGQIGTPGREHSVKQMVDRVAQTIAGWGRDQAYFATEADSDAFEAELTHILVNQIAAFNSPVWFNVGVNPKPQCSACFINSVRDDMRSILNLATTEGMLFKYGSGTGSNLSTLRSSKERLSHSSGKSSGPVSFMKGYDAFAGVIKSGGKTRRAAKMVILNVDHPDIVEFVECRAKEERKAHVLIKHGYDAALDGEAYSSITFQNANNSVRVTDDFMRAVINDGEWQTRAVTNGDVVDTYKARDIMEKIAKAAWECGDPGMQYDTTINRWHPTPNSGRINGSNPCVTGDTLVATMEGYRRIADLVGKSADIVDADGKSAHVTEIFPTGRKQVYGLRTASGYGLQLTADHRVWTKNRGDVAAADLRQGDVLELRKPGFGAETLHQTLAEAVGLALGDGCLTGEQEMAFISGSHAEVAMLGAFNERLNAYKKSVATDGRSARRSSVVEAPTTSRIGTSSRTVVEPLKKFAVLDKGSQAKRFTDEVFVLDQESQAAVLRGLFSADGTVANYGEKSQYVALDSSSLTMLRQVQLLLLGFGIKAKLYENRRAVEEMVKSLPDGKGGYADYPVQQMHSLRVSRSSRLAFEREIGFVEGSPKIAALARLNAEVGTYKDELTDEFGSLEKLGVEDVFDLTEPTTDHFVANGLVVHNCSEYMFLDDTACNLASLNLMKFRTDNAGFDVDAFKHVADVIITAQEILVDNSSYPTPSIEQNSFDFRPLGIGYANLGALLMSRGLAYDSDEGRNFAGAVTALLSGESYYQSAKVAEAMGPFRYYKVNEKPFLKVIGMHRDHAYAVPSKGVPESLMEAARNSWDKALEEGMASGIRNAQISVLAPTGTIGFLMDCDTTGVEPDIALVKYKWLVGGGLMKLVNGTVPEALHNLGYGEVQVREIIDHIDKTDTIEGAPHLKDEHLAVFDCAFKPAKGQRTIHYMGHVRMMAAVQPFISGAISKTVNMPANADAAEIANVYLEGWKLGLKAIAIYRDGSKGQQVLTTSAERNDEKKNKPAEAVAAVAQAAPVREVIKEVYKEVYKPLRRRLPDERKSLTHKFSIAGHEGYITVGLYSDGSPGEIFIRMAKGGTVVSGLMDAFATSTSIALQYGVPLKVLVNKFVHVRFEPSGITSNPSIRIAKSLVDYIFRWLASKFLTPEEQTQVGIHTDTALAAAADAEVGPATVSVTDAAEHAAAQLPLETAPPGAERARTSDALTMSFDLQSDAPACETCGAIMIRSAACYKCMNCGSTSGCS
ncbi:MAG: LAGLIDADG family homing endonuclease [Patescibacteria group bacterium]